MPVKKEIVYPLFFECIEYCKDSFWENIFEELSYGKPPSGTYISKNFLCCSYKGKEFCYKIERKDSAEILYNDIYTLLTDKLGILSQKEKIQKKLVFDEIEKTIKKSREEWGTIRKKNVKDILFEKYVIDMKRIHNLPLKECRKLLSSILICVMFKTITQKDITYSEDKIKKIEGIDIENGEVFIRRPLCEISKEAQQTEKEVPLVSANWERYLKTIRENVRG